ncbi:MAG: pyridoxamine 5'-phosphate oxidase family protein [Nitrososphaerota archaeon]|nr:pyridoxamine 5'-phosphate oxidase family protein [Nitrososphaerota archaeon]MDG6939164.1 pyridoxamine 5'-phosphate oxidase family protein [Nitrososphaerota archaeon]
MEFDDREKGLVEENDLCRLATLSPNGWPHCVPVGYVYLGGSFYVPASGNSKKVLNLRGTNRATILIDEEKSESGVMIECVSRMLGGDEAARLREYMRRRKGWQNDETTAVIKLEPVKKASWSPGQVR